MFLRKTIIICQVQVHLLLVPFLDMLSSIPGVLSVYSSLVLNHISTFLSILKGMLRKPWLRLLLAHFEKHENFNTLQEIAPIKLSLYNAVTCVCHFKKAKVTWRLKARVVIEVFSFEVKKYVSEILYFFQTFPHTTQYAEFPFPLKLNTKHYFYDVTQSRIAILKSILKIP